MLLLWPQLCFGWSAQITASVITRHCVVRLIVGSEVCWEWECIFWYANEFFCVSVSAKCWLCDTLASTSFSPASCHQAWPHCGPPPLASPQLPGDNSSSQEARSCLPGHHPSPPVSRSRGGWCPAQRSNCHIPPRGRAQGSIASLATHKYTGKQINNKYLHCESLRTPLAICPLLRCVD